MTTKRYSAISLLYLDAAAAELFRPAGVEAETDNVHADAAGFILFCSLVCRLPNVWIQKCHLHRGRYWNLAQAWILLVKSMMHLFLREAGCNAFRLE
jgi:hypothetical protein